MERSSGARGLNSALRAPGADAPRPRPAVGNPHALGQKPLSFNRQVGCRCSRRSQSARSPGSALRAATAARGTAAAMRLARRDALPTAHRAPRHAARGCRGVATAAERSTLSGRSGGKLTWLGAAGAVARHRAVPAGPSQGPGAVLQGAGPPARAAAALHACPFTRSRLLRASASQEAVDRARETLTKVRASRGRCTRGTTTGADLRSSVFVTQNRFPAAWALTPTRAAR